MRVCRRMLGALVAAVASLLLVPSALASSTVTVHAQNTDGTPITGYVYVTATGASSSPGYTMTNGDASFPLADGSYTFYVSASNMDDSRRYYLQGSGAGTTDPVAATTVVLNGSPLTFSITFPVIATLSGHVSGPDGSPMANLAVSRNRLGSVKSTTTNANGDYSFGFVQAGTYNITTGSTATVAPGQASVTMPASGAVTQDFALVRKASISGTLTDATTGDPIPNLAVAAYRKSDTGYQNSTFTDAGGHFTITGVTSEIILQYTDPLNGYPLRWSGGAVFPADATGIATVPETNVVHNETLAATPDPRLAAHTLSGVVSASGGVPLGAIEVTADDGTTTYSTTSDRLGRWALATPDGQFTVGFVQGGGWSQLTPTELPWFSQYYPAAWNPTNATTVTVAGGGAVNTVDTTMVRSGLLHIPVATPSGDTVTSGYSIVDGTGMTVNVVTPPQNGTSAVSALVKPGTYRVFITGTRAAGPANVALVPQWYSTTATGRAKVYATAVSVAAGQTVNGVQISLPATFAALSAPTISGTAAAGKLLTGSTGIWNQQTGSTYTYRWTRGSTTVGTASTYPVQLLDAGVRLRLTVNGTNTGLSGTTFREVRVAKLATTTTAAVRSPSRRTVRLVVRVRGSGLVPAGRVVIRRGTVIVATMRLVGGRVTALVAGQPSGRQVYRVSYLGTSRHRTSRSALIAVTVT